MGKDCGLQQHYSQQAPIPKRLNVVPNLGQENFARSVEHSIFANYCSVPVNSSTAANIAGPENLELKSLSGAWYPYFPLETLSLTPKLPGEKFNVFQYGNAAQSEKRLFVLDYSGNQSNLGFSSAGYNSRDPFSLNLKLPHVDVSDLELPKANDATIPCVGKVSWEDHAKVASGGSGSEMHEDTEELDALLYSDDDEVDDEDEVASTGHSPTEMPEWRMNEVIGDDEVASSMTPVKRRRLGEEHDPSLVDTASSRNGLILEDGAESSCVKGGILEHRPSLSKRLKRERICKTVGILRSILSGGKGSSTDAVVVLDEAIQYLKSMRLKAKALGVATLV